MTFFGASCRNAINFVIAIPLTERITIFENFPLTPLIKLRLLTDSIFKKRKMLLTEQTFRSYL